MPSQRDEAKGQSGHSKHMTAEVRTRPRYGHLFSVPFTQECHDAGVRESYITAIGRLWMCSPWVTGQFGARPFAILFRARRLRVFCIPVVSTGVSRTILRNKGWAKIALPKRILEFTRCSAPLFDVTV